MAFQSASGYNNLPNGNFSPVIYSKKVQKQFRKVSVIESVTNNDYMGEIANYGDSVKVVKEPEIAVNDYARGTQVVPQDLVDSDFTLVVDRSQYFAFRVDDIETLHSHVGWESMASDRAAYKLKDHYDRDILAYMTGYDYNKSTGLWAARTAPVGTKAESTAGVDELLASNKIFADDFGGTGGNSVAVDPAGSGTATPLQVLNRINRMLDLKNVPTDGRWVIVDPIFIEKLMDENSKFMNHDYQMSETMANGQLSANAIRGFTVYKSNNLPVVGTGAGTIATAGSSSNYGIIVAGHKSAVATATQITKTEKFRDTQSFGDVVRGMQLYARKILRPEAIVTTAWNVYS